MSKERVGSLQVTRGRRGSWKVNGAFRKESGVARFSE